MLPRRKDKRGDYTEEQRLLWNMISTDNDLMPAIYTQESAKSRALRALRAFVGHVPSCLRALVGAKKFALVQKKFSWVQKKISWVQKKISWVEKNFSWVLKKSRGSKKNLVGPEIFWPGSKPVRFRCCVDSNSCSENLWV